MAESPNVLFRIPPRGLDDLAAAAAHAEKLVEIVQLIAKADIRIPGNLITKSISENIGLPESQTAKILDALSSLRGLMDRLKLSVEQVVAGIDYSIQSYATDNWKQRNLENWRRAQDIFVVALRAMPAESPLSIQQKARELTFAHQHVLTDAALITDLRPVYNAAGDKIHAIVLTHVLTLNYQDGTAQRRIEFALDAGDVAKLFKTVERAQVKTEAALRTFADLKLTLMVPGIASQNSMEERHE